MHKIIQALLLIGMGVMALSLSLTVNAQEDAKYDELYNQFYEHYVDEEYELAIDFLDELIALDPNNSELYYWRGLSNEYLGKTEAALDDYRQALDHDFENVNGLNYRADIYYRLEDYESAVQDLKELTTLEPDNVDHYENLALALFELEDYEEGLAQMQQAFALTEEPDSRLYNNRAIFYDMLDERQLALQDYGKALELEPDDPILNYNIGNSFYDVELYEQAEASYLRAAELDPTYTVPHLMLAMIYIEEHNDYVQAQKYFNQFLVLTDGRIPQRDQDIYRAVREALTQTPAEQSNLRNAAVIVLVWVLVIVVWRFTALGRSSNLHNRR